MVFIVKVIFNQEVVKLESDVKVINSIVGTVVCGPSLGHDATLMTNIVIETFIDVIGSLASAKDKRCRSRHLRNGDRLGR